MSGVSVSEVKQVLEAALLSAHRTLSLVDLSKMFDPPIGADTLRVLLDDLRIDWRDRSVELVATASGWCFRTQTKYGDYLARLHEERPPSLSRAVLETLAIIAYRQPVSRGDIEAIRGVTVSSPTLKSLEDLGWIDVVGHRDTPGRPALFGTTPLFLDHLGLNSLSELPSLADLMSRLPISASPPTEELSASPAHLSSSPL